MLIADEPLGSAVGRDTSATTSKVRVSCAVTNHAAGKYGDDENESRNGSVARLIRDFAAGAAGVAQVFGLLAAECHAVGR